MPVCMYACVCMHDYMRVSVSVCLCIHPSALPENVFMCYLKSATSYCSFHYSFLETAVSHAHYCTLYYSLLSPLLYSTFYCPCPFTSTSLSFTRIHTFLLFPSPSPPFFILILLAYAGDGCRRAVLSSTGSISIIKNFRL